MSANLNVREVDGFVYLVATDDIARVIGRSHIVGEYTEDVGRRTGRFALLMYCGEVEVMTSWVGRYDAISVDRRFIRGCNCAPEKSHSLQPDVQKVQYTKQPEM